MGLHIVSGASFSTLRTRLLRDLGERHGSGCARSWIVVPTSSVANQLRLEWMRTRSSEDAWAGVQAIPLNALVRRLAHPLGVRLGTRRGPLIHLLLRDLCRTLARTTSLKLPRRLLSLPGGHQMLLPTFLDLADGGFGPRDAELVWDLSENGGPGLFEREVLQAYCCWLEWLEKHRIGWLPLRAQDLVERVSQASSQRINRILAVDQSSSTRLYWHGFYDFTDTNLELLAALSQHLDCILLTPFAGADKAPHAAFSFSAAVLDDLRLRLGTRVPSEERLAEPARSLASWFLSAFPDDGVAEPHSGLSIQSASGSRSEAIAAALQVREWLDEDSALRPSDIWIAAPDVDDCRRTLREAFSSFGVPLRVLDPLPAAAPESRALRMLARIWEERGAAEWVLGFLRDFPPHDVDIVGFERKVRRHGIWGAEAWNWCLTAAPEHLQRRAGADAEEPECEDDFTSQERDWILRILEFTTEWPPGCGIPEAMAFLNRLQDFWLRGFPGLLRPLIDALDRFGRRRRNAIIPEKVLRHEMESLGFARRSADTWNQDAVALSSFMRLRGICPKRLVVLGLSSDRFPRRIEEDPLLTDGSRMRLARLAGHVGHRLPLKTRASEEQMLLFHLLTTSADRVHWVVPVSDGSGRAVAPTPWIQGFLRRRRSDSAQVIRRGPRDQARFLLEAAPGGIHLPPRLGIVLWDRTRDPAPEDDARTACKPDVPRVDLDREASLSRIGVTSLEDLARCPFRFYVNRIAKWRQLEPLQMPQEPPPRERGSLLHGVLERLLSDFAGSGASLLSISRDIVTRQGSLPASAISWIEAWLRTNTRLPTLFQRAALAQAVRVLEAYFSADTAGAAIYPDRLEVEVSRPFPNETKCRVTARIDRIDQEGDRRRVIDYKSGRLPPGLRKEVRLGLRVQPWLYPWIVEVEDQEDLPIEFGYIFLGEGEPAVYPCMEGESPGELLDSLSATLRAGAYPASSNEALRELGLIGLQPCLYCGAASVCRRFEIGAPRRQARDFETEGSARLAFLRTRAEKMS